MRKTVWMPIFALALAVLILFGVSTGLAGFRQARLEQELNGKMQTILPCSTTFTPETYAGNDANIRAVYRGETGYVVSTVTPGYAGSIAMLIGVSSEGRVTGLQVRDMAETPGLGGRALTDGDFLIQFLNTAGDAEVGKTVDALTGATVTSRAIARSVNSAVGFVTGADASSGATSWGG